MENNYLESYKNVHKGKTCAILGGGTSLPKDMRELPEVDMLIGINQHSIILPLDYIVFADIGMWPYVKGQPVTFITKITDLDDYVGKEIIVSRQSLTHNYSGSLALKAADMMGFDKIYVCGTDQYDRGDVEHEDARYWWWQATQTPQTRKDKAVHAKPENLIAFLRQLKNSQNVYFMSGRLKELHQ